MSIIKQNSLSPDDVLKASSLIHQSLNFMTLAFVARAEPGSNVTLTLNSQRLQRPVQVLVPIQALIESIDGNIESNLQRLESLGVDVQALVQQFQESMAPFHNPTQ
jgi:hypothetical protein